MAYGCTVRIRPHAIVETPEFLVRARRLPGEDERAALVDHLAANPAAGDLMVGTGGARKLRWAAKGKGKSGGDIPVFLLSVFGKSQKANLSPAERNELKVILSALANDYRKGVLIHVQGRKKHS